MRRRTGLRWRFGDRHLSIFVIGRLPPIQDFLSDLERLTSDIGKSRFLAALEMTEKGARNDKGWVFIALRRNGLRVLFRRGRSRRLAFFCGIQVGLLSVVLSHPLQRPQFRCCQRPVLAQARR